MKSTHFLREFIKFTNQSLKFHRSTMWQPSWSFSHCHFLSTFVRAFTDVFLRLFFSSWGHSKSPNCNQPIQCLSQRTSASRCSWDSAITRFLQTCGEKSGWGDSNITTRVQNDTPAGRRIGSFSPGWQVCWMCVISFTSKTLEKGPFISMGADYTHKNCPPGVFKKITVYTTRATEERFLLDCAKCCNHSFSRLQVGTDLPKLAEHIIYLKTSFWVLPIKLYRIAGIALNLKCAAAISGKDKRKLLSCLAMYQ